MSRVYVTRPLPEPSTREILAGYEVEIGARGEGLLAAAPHVDAILPTPADPVTREVIEAAPRLRIVANCAVGTDNVDLAACRERGVIVTNTPGVLTESTADLTFALILAVTRRLREGEALLRSGTWDGWKPTELLGMELSGKTLGIFGAGRIGNAVARRAEAFGMRVLAVTSKDGAERFEELLSTSDVVTLHAPLTPATRLRFGAQEFARMKRGAYLVNTSRGALVDENALCDALDAGHLRGAALDVYELEPEVNPRLLSMKNVVLVPHIGSATEEARNAMARATATDVGRVLRGQQAINIVG